MTESGLYSSVVSFLPREKSLKGSLSSLSTSQVFASYAADNANVLVLMGYKRKYHAQVEF